MAQWLCTVALIGVMQLAGAQQEECLISWPMSSCCSSHGTWVANNCICDAGWDGLGDFMDLRGLDCQNHVGAIQGIWAAAACAIALSLLLTLHRLWRMRQAGWALTHQSLRIT